MTTRLLQSVLWHELIICLIMNSFTYIYPVSQVLSVLTSCHSISRQNSAFPSDSLSLLFSSEENNEYICFRVYGQNVFPIKGCLDNIKTMGRVKKKSLCLKPEFQLNNDFDQDVLNVALVIDSHCYELWAKMGQKRDASVKPEPKNYDFTHLSFRRNTSSWCKEKESERI